MHKVAKAPCKSCPYRRDCPSGVWHGSEYEKLPTYDGSIIEQLGNGATGLFLCHQQDGCLCAGWLGTHGPQELLAMRLHSDKVAPEVWGYESPVSLFASGQEACEHGLKEIDNPGAKAHAVMSRLQRKRGI